MYVHISMVETQGAQRTAHIIHKIESNLFFNGDDGYYLSDDHFRF